MVCAYSIKLAELIDRAQNNQGNLSLSLTSSPPLVFKCRSSEIVRLPIHSNERVFLFHEDRRLLV